MSEEVSKEKRTPKEIAKTKCKDIKNTAEKKYCFEKTKSKMEGELARKQLKQLTSEEKAKNEGSLVNEGNDYDVVHNKDNLKYKNDPVKRVNGDEEDDEDLQEGGKRKRRSKKSKKSKKKRSTRKKGKKSRRKTIRRHGRRH